MSSVQVQGNTVLTVERVALHTLYAGRKLIKAIGPLELIDQDGNLWVRVNNWYSQEVLKSIEFYRVHNENYVAYIFENIAGGFYAISIPKNDTNLKTFEERISAVSPIAEYADGLKDEEFRKKIEYHYPGVENNPIHTDDIFTPLFTLSGKVQNTLGKTVKPTLNNESFTTRSKNLFKSGWTSLKQGFKKVDEKTDSIPGVRATKDFVSHATEKIVEAGKNVANKVSGHNQQAPVEGSQVPASI